MLHPRHHLLPDIAALVEIDAVQPVHVGLVRKRIAIHEVDAAARRAAGDAMGVIGRAIDQVGADQVCGLRREIRRDQDAPAEFRRADRQTSGRASWRARRPTPRARRDCRTGSRPPPWRAACRTRACRRAPAPARAGSRSGSRRHGPTGASVIRKSAVILPCGVSSAPNRPRPGWTRPTSVVTRPLRKSRASSPLTLTTPRSGRNAAFISSSLVGNAGAGYHTAT